MSRVIAAGKRFSTGEGKQNAGGIQPQSRCLPHIAIPGTKLELGRHRPASELAEAERRADQMLAARSLLAPAARLPNEPMNAVILPTRSVDIMFELLDCEFTIGDDALNEIADGDNSNQLSIIDHW